jgi:hypothetical protein
MMAAWEQDRDNFSAAATMNAIRKVCCECTSELFTLNCRSGASEKIIKIEG